MKLPSKILDLLGIVVIMIEETNIRNCKLSISHFSYLKYFGRPLSKFLISAFL